MSAFDIFPPEVRSLSSRDVESTLSLFGYAYEDYNLTPITVAFTRSAYFHSFYRCVSIIRGAFPYAVTVETRTWEDYPSYYAYVATRYTDPAGVSPTSVHLRKRSSIYTRFQITGQLTELLLSSHEIDDWFVACLFAGMLPSLPPLSQDSWPSPNPKFFTLIPINPLSEKLIKHPPIACCCDLLPR